MTEQIRGRNTEGQQILRPLTFQEMLKFPYANLPALQSYISRLSNPDEAQALLEKALREHRHETRQEAAYDQDQ